MFRAPLSFGMGPHLIREARASEGHVERLLAAATRLQEAGSPRAQLVVTTGRARAQIAGGLRTSTRVGNGGRRAQPASSMAAAQHGSSAARQQEGAGWQGGVECVGSMTHPSRIRVGEVLKVGKARPPPGEAARAAAHRRPTEPSAREIIGRGGEDGRSRARHRVAEPALSEEERRVWVVACAA